jgi:hypothetical protein
MATRFITKSVATAALGIALGLALGPAITTSPAWGNTAGALQLDRKENPFAGSWSGTWSEPGGVEGTHDWTISNAGRMTGTIYNITYDISGAMVGHVDEDGNLNMTFLAPGDDPSISGFHFRGTAVIDDVGSLVVSCTGSYSGGPVMDAILERN